MDYSKLKSKLLPALTIVAGTCYYACSNPVNSKQVNKNSSGKQENPKWLRAVWNVDSSLVNYDDGRVEKRISTMSWIIEDTLIRIEEISVFSNDKTESKFPYTATESHINLEVPGMQLGTHSNERWNIEIIDSGKMILTHHAGVINQILYLRKL